MVAHSRSTTRQLGRGGLPPSLAPLVHNDSRQSVGAGHARPATLLCPPSTGIHPLTPAAAWGQAALRTLFKVACRGGGTPSAGRRGRRPLRRRSVRLLIAANLPGVPSPSRNSDGNAYVAYTKDSNEAGTYSEVSKTNKLDAGFTANANSTLNGKTGNEA